MDRPASLAAGLIAATMGPAPARRGAPRGGAPPSLPAGADARGAPDRGVGRATDPHGQLGLYGLRRDGDTLQLIEGAVEVDRLLSPQATDDLEAFVGLAAARPGGGAEGLPFPRQ